MPSMRRIRVYSILVVSVVVCILYLTSSARQSRDVDLYDSTKKAMNHPHGDSSASRHLGADLEDDVLAAAMSGRLKEAEVAAKEQANAKAPSQEGYQDVIDKQAKKGKTSKKMPKVEITGEKPPMDRNFAGRKNYPVDTEKEVIPEQSIEDKDVEAELNTILKKSPIIIFSKSYCPYSKKAKQILLSEYSIVPAPYVVEIDLRPDGPLLQAKLAEMTGRRTVPNILVTGKSIGGGDDIEAMDIENSLVSKLKTMGGKRMVEVKKLV